MATDTGDGVNTPRRKIDQVRNIAASAATSAGDAADYIREHDAEDMGPT